MTRRNHRIVASLIFLAVTGLTLLASTRQGICRDEAYYMEAAERYVAYYAHAFTGRLERPLSRGSVERYWSYNHEHPPLMKTLFGLSWRAFHRCSCATDPLLHPDVVRVDDQGHRTVPLLSELTAFRLPAALAFGLLCSAVYLVFVHTLGSPWGGLAAALLMLAQPRAFYHAQTACMDLPAATLWFIITFAYWRAIRRNTWSTALLTGVLYGLFLATKLQSFFLPIALGAHWMWLWTQRWRNGRQRPTLKPLLAMLIVGPAVLFSLWPWLWHDTVARIGAYLGFHQHHVHYDFEYFGRNLVAPPFPWHEPLGMLVTTAPVVLLVLAAAGVAVFVRSDPTKPSDEVTSGGEGIGVLMLLAGIAPLAPFLSGAAPIYGATKHWLALMPFLALMAGVAVDRLSRGLTVELGLVDRAAARRALAVGLLVLAVAPAAYETWRSHPYGLSHYNALAGGAPGGADLGMNRQFWGYSVLGALPWLNDTLPRGARVFFHDCNPEAYRLYLRSGLLRRDIADATDPRPGDPRRPPDAALVVHEKHFNGIDYMIWQTYGHLRPAQVLTLDGVPLVSIYLPDERP